MLKKTWPAFIDTNGIYEAPVLWFSTDNYKIVPHAKGHPYHTLPRKKLERS
jgi:hypothetical protein